MSFGRSERFAGIICALTSASLTMGACGGPEASTNEPDPVNEPEVPFDAEAARLELRSVLESQGVTAIEPAPADVPAAKIELGRMLFFDPEMSGNRDAACVMCHRMTQATVDGLSLPVGTKARIWVDTDGDGALDVDESRAGSDPNDPDSDDDGILDGIEIRMALAPMDPTAPADPTPYVDSDGDGLTDEEERMLSFDPEDADTDGDGLEDGEEYLVYRFSPVFTDSDGDGILDGDEVQELRDQPSRTPGPELSFVVRNVPDLFNRGQSNLNTMFWDMRMGVDPDTGRFVLHDLNEIFAPGSYLRVLPEELDNMLAAQNMLPVLNRDELRGTPGDVDIISGAANELALVPDPDLESVWQLATARFVAIPGYRELIQRAYPEIVLEELEFFHLANALSSFIIDAFTLTDSPFDRFLRGEDEAMSDAALRGALVFYGKGKCGACHTGSMLTDQRFHNIAVPPMTDGPDPLEFMDQGVTHRAIAGPDARFSFRTPPLRNVALTAPYMHNGAYTTLREVLRHKADVMEGLWTYDGSQLRWEFRAQVHRKEENIRRVEATISPLLTDPIDFTEGELDDLIAFLESLTDPAALDLEGFSPDALPSGLPMVTPN